MDGYGEPPAMGIIQKAACTNETSSYALDYYKGLDLGLGDNCLQYGGFCLEMQRFAVVLLDLLFPKPV